MCSPVQAVDFRPLGVQDSGKKGKLVPQIGLSLIKTASIPIFYYILFAYTVY